MIKKTLAVCYVASLLFFLMGTTTAQAGIGTSLDTLSFRFQRDSSYVNLSYGENAKSWAHFRQEFETRYANQDPQNIRLDIYSGASPESSAFHNELLGQERGESIRRLIETTYPGRIGEIVVHNEGARWDALFVAIFNSNEPWKQEALEIIGQPAGKNRKAIDPRERQLRALWGGKVWQALQRRYLPQLRSGASAVLSWVGPGTGPVVQPVRDTVVVREVRSQRDTIVIKDTLVIKDTVVMYYVPVPTPTRTVKVRQEVDQSRAWALKTNMLLLAVAAPNIQMEFPLGRKNRWSLEIEFICPWWVSPHNKYCEQVLNLGLELRCWLGKRIYHPCLDGWHIGLAAAAGYYDLEWNAEGLQGEHVNAYLNIGWQHRWGREKRWGVDLGIGLGAIYSPRNRHYLGSSIYPESHTEPIDDHLMYKEHVDHLYPGPTHINVSLMYFFGIRDRKKEVQQ